MIRPRNEVGHAQGTRTQHGAGRVSGGQGFPNEPGNPPDPFSGAGGHRGPHGLGMGPSDLGSLSGHRGGSHGFGPAAGAAMSNIDISYEALSRLPSLDDLGVGPEILEACEELCASAEGPGVEADTLQLLVRLILASKQKPHRV